MRRLDPDALPRRQVDTATAMAARLADVCDGAVCFLHHRRRAVDALYGGEVEHVAVTAQGVVVVDAKYYEGAEVSVRRHRRRRDELFIRGDDRSALLDSLHAQAEAVRVALAGTPWESLPVRTVFCFVDAELPLLGDLVVDGHLVRGTSGTVELLREAGPLDADDRAALWNHLDARMPPA